MKLSPNEQEAANRAEATALLIRSGFRVYRPEADVQGEDLVIRDPHGDLRSVQLKSRPYVDWLRYGDRGIWMLFPEPKFSLGRSWYLVPHDLLYPWVEKRHSHAGAWKQMWSYPSISVALRAFLEPYCQDHWNVSGLASEVVAEPGEDPFRRHDAGTFISNLYGCRPAKGTSDERS